jgi:flagellar basal-body rod protein FlgB
MDISKLKVFNLMQTNMNYLGVKQDVMAQNVSNANTPGYSVKMLKPLDFKAVLGNAGSVTPIAVATSSANHIAIMGNSVAGATYASEADRNPFEITPTGNKVVMEQEMMKLAKNSTEYQQTTNIYRKMLQMLKSTLGDNA